MSEGLENYLQLLREEIEAERTEAKRQVDEKYQKELAALEQDYHEYYRQVREREQVLGRQLLAKYRKKEEEEEENLLHLLLATHAGAKRDVVYRFLTESGRFRFVNDVNSRVANVVVYFFYRRWCHEQGIEKDLVSKSPGSFCRQFGRKFRTKAPVEIINIRLEPQISLQEEAEFEAREYSEDTNEENEKVREEEEEEEEEEELYLPLESLNKRQRAISFTLFVSIFRSSGFEQAFKVYPEVEAWFHHILGQYYWIPIMQATLRSPEYPEFYCLLDQPDAICDVCTTTQPSSPAAKIRLKLSDTWENIGKCCFSKALYIRAAFRILHHIAPSSERFIDALRDIRREENF